MLRPWVCLTLCLATGCATGGARGRGRAAQPHATGARDSVAERLAVLPGADRESSPEIQERRFGWGEAKARREGAATKRVERDEHVEGETKR